MNRAWNSVEFATLCARYADTPTAEIARQLGRTAGSVHQAAAKLGLKKTEAYVKAHCLPPTGSGAAQRFKAGQVAWNKGKAHSPVGSERGHFKAGNMPQTWKPIGTERLDKDGVLVRKISDARSKRDWKPVHVLVYEQHNGVVPVGHIVIFDDGNRANFTPANLIALDRAALMKRNSVHTKYPPEIARLCQLRGAINRQINQRAKHEQDHR